MMNEWIISSSLLIAAVLLGRRLLRGRISLRLQYALWAVVLIRLLVPFQLFTSDFGAGSIAQDMDISEPVRQVYASAREDDYERAYDAAYSQVVAEYLSTSQSFDPVVVEREAAAQAEAAIELGMDRLLTGIWFAGMAVMTAVVVFCNVHLGLQLKRRRWELPVSDSLLPVYVTEAVPTPCIFGFFRPVIYLTAEAAGDEQVRRHVLAHELTHYRHWDHIWSVLRSLCLILHWYNPLVWMAARVSRADAELACDEGALARLGEEHRADYGRTLIGLTCPDHGGSMFVTATTMTGSAGSIRERIKLLMKRPRNTVLALIAVILVGTIVVGCSFARAPETRSPETEQIERDGVLAYPGTSWNMTLEELKTALDIPAEDIFGEREVLHDEKTTDGTYAYAELEARCSFLGYPVEATFQFHSYAPDTKPGLFQIYVDMEEAVGLEEVRAALAEELGEGTENGSSFHWYSDKTIQDLVDYETYNAFVKVDGDTYGVSYDSNVSSIQLSDVGYDSHGVTVVFRSGLPRVIQSGGGTNFGTVAYFDDLLNPDLDRSEADWYPRALTSYYDSPAGIDLFQLFYNGIPGADNSITPEEQAFLEKEGTYEPEFDLVRIPGAEMNRVLTEYFGIIMASTTRTGLYNFTYNPDTDCYYHSHTDTNLGFRTVYDVEELTAGRWRVLYTEEYKGKAEVILLWRDEKWQIVSHLPIEETPLDLDAQAAEVAALFGEGGDSWYLSALTVLYSAPYDFDAEAFLVNGQDGVALTDEAERALISDAYGKDALNKPVIRLTEGQMERILQTYIGVGTWDVDLSGFLYCPETGMYLKVKEENKDLLVPEILDCVSLEENQVQMFYRLPAGRPCVATVLKGETWKVYSNQLVLSTPDDARPLTDEEIAKVNAAFESIIYNEDMTEGSVNPASAFFTSTYEDVRDLDLEEFLRYFPTSGEATEEEFQLLHQHYGEAFLFSEHKTLADMPVPTHRYEVSDIEAVLRRYAGIGHEELTEKYTGYYLTETDSYYNFTSDFGPGSFHCTGGWVYDGGAVLLSSSSALYLTERNGNYYIQAHLPAIVAEG